MHLGIYGPEHFKNLSGILCFNDSGNLNATVTNISFGSVRIYPALLLIYFCGFEK